MIRINLLPVREERRKAGARQFAAALVAALVGTIALTGLVHWKLMADHASVKKSVARTHAEIDRYGPQLEQVEKYRTAKAEIEQKLAVIQTLQEARSGPVHILDELATHIPDRLWITKLDLRDSKMHVQGMSLDNELVALFLTALNDSGYFKGVELVQTRAQTRDGYKLNAFEISAIVTSPAAEIRAAQTKQETAAAGQAPVGAETAATGHAPVGAGR
jgi:type IV pilus assembly protein PilN